MARVSRRRNVRSPKVFKFCCATYFRGPIVWPFIAMASSLYDFLRDPNAPPSPFDEPVADLAQGRARPKGLRESMFRQFRSDRTAALPVEKKIQRREQQDQGRKTRREILMEQRRGRPQHSASEDDMNASQAGLSPARPARAPPVARARGAMDRLAQLRAFQAERDKKRKAQQKTVKPPFRVGVYKLTQDIQQNLAPVQGGENSALKNISSRIDTHRKGARPTPARDPLTAKSNSKAKKSLFNKGSPRKVQRALRTALGRGGKDSVKLMKSAQPWVVSSAKNAETGNAQNDPAKLDLVTEKQDLDLKLIAESPKVITSSPVADEKEPAPTSAKRRRSSRLAPKVRQPSPIVESVIPEEPEDDEDVVSFKAPHHESHTPIEETKSFVPSTSLTPFIAAMEVSKKAEPAAPVCTEVSQANFQFLSPSVVGNFKFTATPKAAELKAPLDKDGFKTPNMRNLGESMKSRRSKRRSEACTLIDPLRKDVVFQRGSNSAKRRLRKGQDPYVDLQDISFDDVPADPFSPFHQVMKSRTKSNLDPVLTPLVNHGGSPQLQRTTPIPKTLAMEFEQINQVDATSNPVVKDVQYFRNLLKTETDRLAALCCHWEAKLEKLTTDPAFSEEITGQIRSVIGKANLMSNRKGRFEQFATLIDNCEFNRGEQKTTCMDLQGFWEMIYFQVEDIDALFKELNLLESSGWMEPATTTKNETNKKQPLKRANLAKSRKAKSPGKSTAALKELMANKRKLMREQAQSKNQSQSSTMDSLKPVDPSKTSPEKVFDGGFFAVRSPLRTISPQHCGPMSNRKISLSADSKVSGTPSLMTKRVTRSSQRLSARPLAAHTLQFNENEEPML